MSDVEIAYSGSNYQEITPPVEMVSVVVPMFELTGAAVIW